MSYDKLVKRLREHNGWALNETLDEAADAIEQLEAAAPKWIPVTERLPERCNFCLVADFGDVCEAYYNSGGVWLSQGNKLKGVSHWMPLPKPPEENKP